MKEVSYRSEGRRFGKWLAAWCLWVVTLAGCGEAPPPDSERPPVDEFGLPEIVVWRRQATPEPAPGVESQPNEDGAGSELFTQVFHVPPTFLSLDHPVREVSPDDPFAGSPGVPGRRTAKEVLEGYGVVFGPGASAIYGPATSQLIVRQTRDQLKLIETVFSTLKAEASKVISIRIEVHEIPALHALKFQQSAATTPDHTGEWEAVLRLVGEGTGRFVTGATLASQSGQRSQCLDVQEHLYVSDFKGLGQEKKDVQAPVFETRNVGTLLEIDPVLSADTQTVDLHLSFEHHSAPPTEKRVTVTLPGGTQPIEVPTPVFHSKKITTQLSMAVGETKLLGVWRPTGKSEFETREVMHLAFLMVDLHSTWPEPAEP